MPLAALSLVLWPPLSRLGAACVGHVRAGRPAGDWALVPAEAVEVQSALPAMWPWPETGLPLQPPSAHLATDVSMLPVSSFPMGFPAVVTCGEHLSAECDLGPAEVHWDVLSPLGATVRSLFSG